MAAAPGLSRSEREDHAEIDRLDPEVGALVERNGPQRAGEGSRGAREERRVERGIDLLAGAGDSRQEEEGVADAHPQIRPHLPTQVDAYFGHDLPVPLIGRADVAA